MCDGIDNDYDGIIDNGFHKSLLRIRSSPKAVQLRVVDAFGRVMKVRQHLASNSNIPIDHNYRPGVYYVEAVQEGRTVTLKLVKTTQ